jgi:hypothetical protein
MNFIRQCPKKSKIHGVRLLHPLQSSFQCGVPGFIWGNIKLRKLKTPLTIFCKFLQSIFKLLPKPTIPRSTKQQQTISESHIGTGRQIAECQKLSIS